MDTTIENLKKGDKVQFYGKGTSITTYYKYLEDEGVADFTSIADGTAEVKVYGNIMSLVNETGYATATTLTSENTFLWLFCENSKLTDASGLLLPATTLTESCYYGMFSGCTSLENAPALPAEAMANYCYQYMFHGCMKLNAVTCLATDISADGCTNGWLVSAGLFAKGEKTFTKAASMEDWTTGTDGIPSGWTVVDYVAPSN